MCCLKALFCSPPEFPELWPAQSLTKILVPAHLKSNWAKGVTVTAACDCLAKKISSKCVEYLSKLVLWFYFIYSSLCRCFSCVDQIWELVVTCPKTHDFTTGRSFGHPNLLENTSQRVRPYFSSERTIWEGKAYIFRALNFLHTFEKHSSVCWRRSLICWCYVDCT